MALLYRRCAGLDIYRDTVVACVRLRVPGGGHEEKRETFATFTGELKKRARWLHEYRVKQGRGVIELGKIQSTAKAVQLRDVQGYP